MPNGVIGALAGMGGASAGGGVNLGRAHGSITIDTTSLARASQTARQVGREIGQSLGRDIGRGAQQAESNFQRVNRSAADLGRSLNGLAALFGVSFGAAQLIRTTLAANDLATSYRRQQVAAVSLAGSQDKVNALLAAYDRATGGAIDKATALADVVSLQTQGFADNAQQLEQFLRGVRGAALATGKPQEFIITRLQLELLNQTGMRLNEIGLAMQDVDRRTEKLRQSNSTLTKEAAYQQAVLGLLAEKFGDLATSQEAQATGAERARKAFRDLRLEWGQLTGPGVSAAGNWIADYLARIRREATTSAGAIEQLSGAMSFFQFFQGIGFFPEMGGPRPWPSEGRFVGNLGPSAITQPAPSAGPSQDFLQAQSDFVQEMQEIERDAQRARLDATRQYEQQRSEMIAQYERSIARAAEDYARQRAQAEENLRRTIADVQADAATRETELRQENQERNAKIEESYQRDRERALRSHRNRLLDAASRLDAVAVAEEQRRFADQQRDAEEAHREQIDNERAALDRRIQETRDAERERIDDLRTTFERQRRLEEEDRAIRLRRQAEDHQLQLDQMAVAHNLRLQQIDDQQQDERDHLQQAFAQRQAELGEHNRLWEELTKARLRNAKEQWDDFLIGINKTLAEQILALRGIVRPDTVGTPAPSGGNLNRMEQFQMGGWVQRTGPAWLHAGEYVLPRQQAMAFQGVGGVSFSGNISVSIMGGTNMGEGQMYDVARRALLDALREMAS